MDRGNAATRKSLVVLVLLLFICFVLMGVSQNKVTVELKSVTFGLMYPFQYAGTRALTFVTDFFSSIQDNRQLKEELKSARQILEQYKRTQYDFEEIKRENERLRRLIGVQSTMEYDTVIAEVIAKSPQNFYKTIVVNRGRRDGIKRYMPVVAYQNDRKCVVGKVTDVQRSSSRIQPLVEQNSYTAAMLKDSRYSGLLQGQSPLSDTCLLQYVDRRVDIQFGDIVVTSGMGGVYPKGIEIGEVVSVTKPRYGIFQEAMVRPFVDLGRLEEVYIITKTVTGELLEQMVPDEGS